MTAWGCRPRCWRDKRPRVSVCRACDQDSRKSGAGSLFAAFHLGRRLLRLCQSPPKGGLCKKVFHHCRNHLSATQPDRRISSGPTRQNVTVPFAEDDLLLGRRFLAVRWGSVGFDHRLELQLARYATSLAKCHQALTRRDGDSSSRPTLSHSSGVHGNQEDSAVGPRSAAGLARGNLQ